jgi:hypothetical protein
MKIYIQCKLLVRALRYFLMIGWNCKEHHEGGIGENSIHVTMSA